MSLKVQRVIRFIPIVNMITVFCWFNLCFKKSITMSFYLKNLLKIFAMVIVITVIRMVVSLGFQNEVVDIVLTVISIYFYFFSMAWVSVSAQESMLAENKDKDS